MGTKDPKIDAYIRKAQPFARPILTHLRAVVHAACPATVEVTKWGMPHFEHLGPMCGMAAFKAHCTFGFWKAALLDDPERILSGEEAMGHLGRIGSLADLPPDRELTRLIKQAVKLNEEGVKVVRERRPKGALVVPAPLLAALRKSAKAKREWAAFTPGKQREYAEWIAEAKSEATLQKRLESAVEWISEGKQRNWKYLKC